MKALGLWPKCIDRGRIFKVVRMPFWMHNNWIRDVCDRIVADAAADGRTMTWRTVQDHVVRFDGDVDR